jgi:hypothetical protein
VLAINNSSPRIAPIWKPLFLPRGNGTGTFQAGVDYDARSFPSSVMGGDFNGDGKLDLDVANTAPTGRGLDGKLPTCGDS